MIRRGLSRQGRGIGRHSVGFWPPVNDFTVLDSDGNSFVTTLAVLDSDGNSFTVSTSVLDADGNSFTVI